MAIGFREQRRRRQRRFWFAVMRWGVAFAAILIAGYYAYTTGARLARADVTSLQVRIDELTATVDTLKRQTIKQQAAVDAQRLEAEEWQRRYQRDVPTGAVKKVVDLVLTRRAEGIPLERLQYVVGAVSAERDCDDDVTTKRFLVRTPLTRGANAAARFVNGTITIQAAGTSARTDDGRPEAWYDPAIDITLSARHLSGEEVATTGSLPLQHALVIGDREHRFSAFEGNRGYVEVTHQSCSFP